MLPPEHVREVAEASLRRLKTDASNSCSGKVSGRASSISR